MREDDFWVEQVTEDPFGWGGPTTTRQLNMALLERLRAHPLDDHSDIEVAVPLAQLIHDEYERHGTDGDTRFTEEQSRLALRSLLAVLQRIGIADFKAPFTSFRSFYTYWIRKGARGSWQARRDLLDETFSDLHDRLADLEAQSLTSSLVDPITPRDRTGWPRIDAEIAELRRHFQNARTDQDYRNVGNDCVIITEALSAQVFDPDRHLRPGETPPPVSSTKIRLDRYVELTLPGKENAELRKMAKACIELAQAVKHRSTPSRRDAGIAADSVIQLANILRRLAEED